MTLGLGKVLEGEREEEREREIAREKEKSKIVLRVSSCGQPVLASTRITDVWHHRNRGVHSLVGPCKSATEDSQVLFLIAWNRQSRDQFYWQWLK